MTLPTKSTKPLKYWKTARLFNSFYAFRTLQEFGYHCFHYFDNDFTFPKVKKQRGRPLEPLDRVLLFLNIRQPWRAIRQEGHTVILSVGPNTEFWRWSNWPRKEGLMAVHGLKDTLNGRWLQMCLRQLKREMN